jgi:hypothetical protein
LVDKTPYTETFTIDSTIRTFSQEIDPIELMWHRDLKNRSVKLLQGSGWKIQLENSLPSDFTEITIPKLVWHRVIKGSSDLVVEIKEWD